MSWSVSIGAMVNLGGDSDFHVEVHQAGYTYNVSGMFAKAGGIMPSKWPEDPTLVAAECDKIITAMEADPDGYRALNPPNGWGDYDGALEFLRGILDACRRAPKAIVSVY